MIRMELRDAGTIDAATLYEHCKQAILLYKSGMTFLAIAPKVVVHRNTVGQWIKAWKEGGQTALKVKSGGRPKGSGRKLHDHEGKVILRCLIDSCPDQLTLPSALWTSQAVQRLLKQRLGVEMTLVSAGRGLKKWGFTPQKTLRRA